MHLALQVHEPPAASKPVVTEVALVVVVVAENSGSLALATHPYIRNVPCCNFLLG
eukprot:COSAG02_NODE_3354_length_6883_cov_188.063237_6_plen_55_part_00